MLINWIFIESVSCRFRNEILGNKEFVVQLNFELSAIVGNLSQKHGTIKS